MTYLALMEAGDCELVLTAAAPIVLDELVMLGFGLDEAPAPAPASQIALSTAATCAADAGILEVTTSGNARVSDAGATIRLLLSLVVSLVAAMAAFGQIYNTKRFRV